MAAYALGITATWNGVSFGEVQSIKANIGGALPLARSCNWTNEPGTVDITCLSTAALSPTNYGVMATLSLAGGGDATGDSRGFALGGTSFTAKAILQRFEAAGSVGDGAGDVMRYAATLRLVSLAGTAVSTP